jgi:hypothetical protein
MRRGFAFVALAGIVIAVSVAAPVAAGAGAAGQETSTERPGRVLIFSLPHVSWADIDKYADELPNLTRLLAGSGVAALTTRADQRATNLGDGYLTLAAGTRAVGDPATDGDNFGINERFGRDRAGDVFTQRTGRPAPHGLVSLAVPRVVDRNDALLYDAEIGAFPGALRDAGFHRAVIANGDGSQPDTPPSPTTSTFRRQAVLGLMNLRGTVPEGQVDNALLQRDPEAPFGVRLDVDAASAAFKKVWQPRSVVLVEASDLVRSDEYRTWASPIHRDVMLRRALRTSDRLLGRLLDDVDLSRDTVVVFGPAHSSRTITLTVLGVHAPGVEPGLLRSPTTRRSGFVQLVDVAPTILSLVGVDRPTSMEGRPAEIGATGGSAQDRVDLFTEADAAAQFRDERVGEVQTAFVVFGLALVAGAIIVFRRQRPAWASLWLGRVALCVLGFVPAVFLSRLVPFEDLPFVTFWAFLVVAAIALGTLYLRIGRDRPLDALLCALGVNIVLLIADVVIGTPLEFNGPLGYSPTVAGRFAGLSNPAYAVLGASAVLAAPMLARRIGGRRGTWLAVALLAVVVFVDGAPFWGSDVGGIISLVPAFAVTAVLMLGLRIRWKTVAWGVVGLVVALAAFGALDLSRSPDQRTHFGRLLVRINQRGLGDFVVIVQRKLADNLGTLTNSIWMLMLPGVAILLIWLARRAPDRLPAIERALPATRASLIGFAVLALLGYAVNDSGIAIPGVMLVIFVPCVAWLLVRFPPAAPRQPAARGRAPRVTAGAPSS